MPLLSHRLRPLTVGGVTLGDGPTKTIVSIAEGDAASAERQASALAQRDDVDLVEFRLDHLLVVPSPDAVAAITQPVAAALAAKPLVVTFRTRDEGGEQAIAPAAYAALYAAVLDAGVGDLFDIQAALLVHAPVAAFKVRAQASGRRVILSHHDFARTPDVATMVGLLRAQQAAGADVAKLAVMPHDVGDLLRLLEATWTMRCDHADRPFLTMAMGGVGAVSRLSGEAFGSAISFGSVGEASAPGQLPVDELHTSILTLHKALSA